MGLLIIPVSQRPATSWVHYTTSCNTQSSAPEDGQNNCPKHVALTGIINKPIIVASSWLSILQGGSNMTGTDLCVNKPHCANGRQHRGCIIPQAVTHSLVLLKMGKIIARNMLL